MAPEDTEENEQNVYGDEGRETLMDDGEISAEELRDIRKLLKDKGTGHERTR